MYGAPNLSTNATVLMILACLVLIMAWIITAILLFRRTYGCTQKEKRRIEDAKEALRLQKWRGERQQGKFVIFFFKKLEN